MSGTLGATYTSLIQLDSGTPNPVTVAATGALLDGVSMAHNGLTLINAGYIGVPGTAASSSSYAIPAAVIMVDSGILINQSGATISGLGSVTQTGTYWGVGSYADTTATVVNAGTIAGAAYGIHFGGTGTVTNQSGGTISGDQGIKGTADAITVLNAGNISGNTSSSGGAAISLAAGGSVTNLTAGTITGYQAIASSNGPVTLVNAGTITSYNDEFDANTAVFLGGGGSVTNESSGAIIGNYAIVGGTTAALTVLNAGLIDGGPGGIVLRAGGSISNQSSGTISGAFAVFSYTAATTVLNAGSISGTSAGVYLDAGGIVSNQSSGVIAATTAIASRHDPATVVNAGRIAGLNTGIRFSAGGSITNQSGGTISAPHAIYVNYDAATVVNAGSIAGGTVAGQTAVFFKAGGSATNQASGTISGYWGVAAYSDAATVTNYGDIAGSDATSSSGAGVNFAAGGSVINHSGATISGYKAVQDVAGILIVVNGGNIAGSAFNNTITSSVTTYVAVNHQTYTRTTNAIISSSGAGVIFNAGGSVTNQIGGAISGYRAVAAYNDAVTVLNDGTIAGSTTTEIVASRTILQNITIETGTSSFSTYTTSIYITNDSHDAGVFLGAGGSITNLSSGTISGYHAIAGYANAATVVNDGSIAGNADTISNGIGILLGTGASVINQAAGVISGFRGIDLTASGTVLNYGSVTGSNFGSYQSNQRGSGVDLTGGSLTNQSGGTISGYWAIAAYTDPATVVNIGDITASMNESSRFVRAGGRGVYLQAGGSIANQSGGTISGWDGIRQGTTGALTGVNYGDISGAVARGGPNYKEGNGVYFVNGSFTNQIGGTVSGYQAIVGLGRLNNVISLNNAVVVNAGLIEGNHYSYSFANVGNTYFGADAGVYLPRGGEVTNLLGGTIIGNAAILAQRFRLYLVNDGSLIGGEASTDSGDPLIDGSGVNLDAGSVTNQASGFISGYWGIYNPTPRSPVTVVNAGTIDGASVGIYVGGGFHGKDADLPQVSSATSFITNQSGGTIIGGILGIDDAVNLVNAGRIEGNVNLSVGGSVTNQSGDTIQGGVYGYFQPLTVVNAGDIVGGNQAGGGSGRLSVGLLFGRDFGIAAPGGGNITNQSGGTISGFYAVAGYNEALTVVNAGTLVGVQDALYFSSGTKSRLVVDPGAVFTGNIVGGGGIVELASASSPGTLYGFGTSVSNFGTLLFDSGAAWTVAGNDSASGLGTLAITGFTIGDTIDLTGFVAVGKSFASNQLLLTDTSNAHTTLAIVGNFTSSDFLISSDSRGGTDITLCFLAGTRIQTPLGAVPVEHLAAGDKVLTHRGETRQIVWMGTGRVLATPARRSDATPVIIRQGALAENVPNRDLRVTKGHSFYLDDVLIPAEFLVNHRSIIWDDHAREVQLYHVELVEHDILLANGAPAESYRDDGNRWLFANANSGWDQPPKEPCAPVLTGGPIVDAVWRRLLDRSGPLPDLPLTEAHDLHVLVDGQRVNPVRRHDKCYTFELQQPPRAIRIVSHASSPAELGLARDPRVLGVAIRQIRLWQGRQLRMIDASDDALQSGFHEFEEANGFRWTDGDALVPSSLLRGLDSACTLELWVECGTTYLLRQQAA